MRERLYIKCPACRGTGKVSVNHPRGGTVKMDCEICDCGFHESGLSVHQFDSMNEKLEKFRDLYYKLSKTPSSGLGEIAKEIGRILKILED